MSMFFLVSVQTVILFILVSEVSGSHAHLHISDRLVIAGLPWVWRFPWGFPWVWVMGTVMNPHGAVGILLGFLMGVRFSRNALSTR